MNERAAGVDDVVDDEHISSAHIADDVHHFGLIFSGTALVDDRQRCIEALRVSARALDAAGIGRYDRQLLDVQLAQMIDDHRRRRRLHDEDVRAAHVLVDLHVVLTIGKTVKRALSRLFLQEAADLPSELRMGTSGEDFQRTVQAGEIIQNRFRRLRLPVAPRYFISSPTYFSESLEEDYEDRKSTR